MHIHTDYLSTISRTYNQADSNPQEQGKIVMKLILFFQTVSWGMKSDTEAAF